MMILPSRGRPALVKRFIEAYNKTGATCPVILRLDADDPTLLDYPTREERISHNMVRWPDLPIQWKLVIGPRMKCPEACQWMFEQYPDEPWYSLFGDDVVPETPGWDRALIEAAGTKKVSYGYDAACWPLATHPVIGGDFLRAVGYYAIPGMLHWYLDTMPYDLAKVLGRLVPMPEIKIPHLHLQFEGKTDQTNDERFLDLKTGIMHTPDYDIAIWNKWVAEEMPKAIERIKKLAPL